MIEIINNSSAVKHLPENGIVLQPGTNQVDKDLFKENLDNPLIQESVDNGVLNILGDLDTKEPEPQEEEVSNEIKKELPNPDKFTVDDFLPTFVDNEDRVEVLEEYIEMEELNQGRVTLISGVKERISEVK